MNLNESTVEYLQGVQDKVQRVLNEEQGNIEKAADVISDSLNKGDLLHVFGSSHSLLLAKEIFYRAGGLVPIDLISEPPLTCENATQSTFFERFEGYAEEVLDKYPLKENEVFIDISTSGRNAVPIEMALGAKDRGLDVVAVTSLEYTKNVKSRHSSEKKLYEIADVVIDNKTESGDAIVEVEGVPNKMGPTSAAVGAAILHSLTIEVAEKMAEKGEEPPVWLAANVPGGDEANKEYISKFKQKIRHL